VQNGAWLVYDETKPLPIASEAAEEYDNKSQNDLKFIPLDGQKPLGPVTLQYVQLLHLRLRTLTCPESP
jgi:hypothetical protein